jgi:hypothetical protein
LSWKDRWNNCERPARPARARLTPAARDELLEALRRNVAKSPVLAELHVEVTAARGFFHFSRRYPGDDRPFEIARAVPLAEDATLMLEAQSSRATYYFVAKGKPATIVRALAMDTAGTFHGLGAIERHARTTKGGLVREKLRRSAGGFAYAIDGERGLGAGDPLPPLRAAAARRRGAEALTS